MVLDSNSAHKGSFNEKFSVLWFSVYAIKTLVNKRLHWHFQIISKLIFTTRNILVSLENIDYQLHLRCIWQIPVSGDCNGVRSWKVHDVSIALNGFSRFSFLYITFLVGVTYIIQTNFGAKVSRNLGKRGE